MSRIDIAPISSPGELASARAVRQRVFVDEQACPPEEEWDAYDDASRHFIGRLDGRVVATARWRAASHDERIVAKLERFAVDKPHRGSGYGRMLVRAVMADARRAGFEDMLLHAQAHLVDFYASFGFKSTGRRFEEAGIPHVEMVRLTAPSPRQ